MPHDRGSGPDARPGALSYNELLVLQAVSTGCRYGFDLMGLTGLSAGTVYPLLRRLDAQRLLESSKEPEAEARAERRPARRLYAMTPRGAQALAEARDELLARHRAVGLLPQEP